MDRSPKAELARFLYKAGLLNSFHVGASNHLTIFNYHRIRPDDPAFSTPYNDEIYGPTVSEFEEQVEWLVRHTRLLSEAELIAAVNSGQVVKDRCSMITFDDGYLDNYVLAWPILERYRAPAAFFIPSHLIGSRRLGWWDLISYFIKKTQKPEIVLDGAEYSVGGDRRTAIDALIARMTLERSGATDGLLDRLSIACNVPFPSAAEQSAELMTWDQVREVSDGIITIGSHSHTHRVFATLDVNTQRQELELSKTIVERETGNPVRSIAYPVGGYRHFTADTQELARVCGYSLAYSFATGVNRCDQIRRFDVKRVSSPLTAGFLAAKASIPMFFARS